MTAITAACFPTPHLMLRTNDADEVRRIGRFADEQVAAAVATAAELREDLGFAGSYRERTHAFVKAYGTITRWRADLAERTTRRFGLGLEHDPSRFVTTITDGGPNYDHLGYVGWLRENAVWDPERRVFRGGQVTPAHLIMIEYGRLATARFALEAPGGETLRNPVTLPDGTRVTGNSLVRGAAARRAAADLVTRIARRGADASQIETGGDPMYAVTAADGDRERMFHAAMTVLAGAADGDVGAWQAARYLLYQAPMIKKGSDAVIRTFLVTAGAVLLGRPPILQQDVDLRCIVAGQAAATTIPGDP
jgi:hypothetical protein